MSSSAILIRTPPKRSSAMRISKSIEFEYGHRVTYHKSKCKGFHGHHGKLVVHLNGKIVTAEGVSEQGMVMDFADVKRIAMEQIHDPLDHGFIVWEKDMEAVEALERVKGNKTVKMPFVPTAENLAKWCFEKLDPYYKEIYGNRLQLDMVEFHETPTSIAYYSRADLTDDHSGA